MAGNFLNFTIENRAGILPDVQKSWMFQVIIPEAFKVAPRSSMPFGPEDLLVRCQSITIPQTTIEELETLFMGTKQAFPGKKNNGGDAELTFYETEDQQMGRFFYEWQQRIFNLDPDNNVRGGGSLFPIKRAATSSVIVQAFKYDKTPLPFQFKLYNCWPKNVSTPQFNWGASEAVSYSVTLRCDYWKLVFLNTNTDYTIGQ